MKIKNEIVDIIGDPKTLNVGGELLSTTVSQ